MVGWVHTAQDAVSTIYYLLSSMSYLGRVPSFSSLNRPVITSPLMLTEAIYNFHTCPPGMWRECWYQALHCSLYLYLDTPRWCPRLDLYTRYLYTGTNWPTFICIGECNGGHVDISVRVILRPSVGLLLRRYDQNPITGCSYWVKTNVASS